MIYVIGSGSQGNLFLSRSRILLAIREPITYNQTMSNKKAPTETPISTGAVLCTAEAAQGDTFSIRLLVVDLKEIHNDVPQLPDRMRKVWEAPGRTTTVPLLPVR